MSEETTRMLDGDGSTTPEGLERRRVPGNVYYYMPLYPYIFATYTLFGSFGCAELSSHVSTNATPVLWIGYALSVIALILLSPEICHECKKTDEEGKEVIVRYPLVGFKACEVELDLEGIEKGHYDIGGRAGERLHDGYRYGTALLRI